MVVVVVSRGLEVVGEDARVRPRVRVCGFRFEGISDALFFTHSMIPHTRQSAVENCTQRVDWRRAGWETAHETHA